MATIALALGTSHSQHVNLPVELWASFAEKDRTDPRVGDFEALSSKKAGWIGPEIAYEKWQERHDRVQAAIGELARRLHTANVEAVVTVGDDQHEIFSADEMAALAIYWGDSIENRPPDKSRMKDWQKAGAAGYSYDAPTAYPGHVELAQHLLRSLSSDGFDLTHMGTAANGRHVGHAFNFVYRRLMGPHVIPQVPVFVNSYYPPNQPSAARCYAFGQSLRRAIDTWHPGKRVAFVASGGLSHFVVDEKLDRAVIAALEKNDSAALTGFPEEVFVHGTSEIKMWITVAGAMSDARFRLIDYLPLYRTTAGSGIGACFAVWEPPAVSSKSVRHLA